MTETAFNLVDEPWIRVLLPDGAAAEVSLRDVLLRAHTFSDLGGELPTQNIAVLRLLLAVLHTVFSRMDETGAQARWRIRTMRLNGGFRSGRAGRCRRHRSRSIWINGTNDSGCFIPHARSDSPGPRSRERSAVRQS